MVGFAAFLNDDPTDWLEEDDDPSVRFFTLRTLMDMAEDHPQVRSARRALMTSGPVPAILDAQHPDGHWAEPGTGYRPKYRGTVWQVIILAQLGADGSDERVARGCEYLLSHSRAKSGAFSATQKPVPSTAWICLNGNLICALHRLGWGHDERVRLAVELLGDSVARHGFACVCNGKLPCAWAAAKVLLAFTSIPSAERTDEVKTAIDAAADLLLSRDLAVADYPCADNTSGNWQKFGFPMNYTSNALEALHALAEAGRGADPRLTGAIRLVLSKQDVSGRWKLETSLNGKMWVDIEKRGKPSKWVTLQAMQTLRRIFGGD